MMTLKIGSHSGGANPLGMYGELEFYDAFDARLNGVAYYSEEVVKRILALDAQAIDYVRRMIKIREEMQPKPGDA